MDDYLDCCPSQEKAIETVHKVIKILSTAGFRTTNWLPNSKNILKTFSPVERSLNVANLDLTGIPIERALGIIWDPQEDILQIKTINNDRKLNNQTIVVDFHKFYL